MYTNCRHVFLTIICILHISITACGQDGEFYSAFGNDGIFNTYNLPGDYRLMDNSIMHFQNDDKILVAGNLSYLTYSDNKKYSSIIRLHPEGRIDSSYNDDGLAELQYQPSNHFTNSMVILKDESIITVSRSTENIILMRFLKNGNHDLNFGHQGVLTFDVSENAEYEEGKILKLYNDKLLLCGTVSHNISNHYIRRVFLSRFHLNGDVDTSFGTNGTVIYTLDQECAAPNSMDINENGKILIMGNYEYCVNGSITLGLAMILNEDGSLDSNFGGLGWKKINPGYYYNSYGTSGHFSGNHILLNGYTGLGYYDMTGLVSKIKLNGDVDSSFGDNGFVLFKIGNNPTWTDCIYSFNRDEIIVGGTVKTGFNGDIYIARMNQNGSFDSEFGINGVISYDLGTYVDNVKQISLHCGDYLIAASTEFDIMIIKVTSGNTSPFCQYIYNPSIKNDIRLYPNPIELSDEINIDYFISKESKVSMRLINAMGQTMKYYVNDEIRKKGNHTESLPINFGFSSGVYIFQIESEEFTWSSRVIIL